MTTTKQLIRHYAEGKLSFDELRNDLAAHTFTTVHRHHVDWAAVYVQAEAMPDDDDFHWVDVAVTNGLISRRQRQKIVDALREEFV